MLILFCGFMGAGKTSKGKILAAKLNSDYRDLDELIVENTGMSVLEIFTKLGEKEFRKIETDTLKNLICQNMVLSLGGGTLDRVENRTICKNAVVIYLDTPFETCYERISNSERPLVKTKSYEELRQLYNSRAQIYNECADIIIKTNLFKEDKCAVITEIYKQLNCFYKKFQRF